MSHRFTLDALKELISARNDSAQGMRICIESLSLSPFENPPLRALLLSYLEECTLAVEELQSLVRLLGGQPDTVARSPESIERRRREIQDRIARAARSRSATASIGLPSACNQDGVILEQCERGESRVLEVYRNAMDDPLPGLVRAIVLRQFEDVMTNHDQIRDLRNQWSPLVDSGAGNGAQAGQLQS